MPAPRFALKLRPRDTVLVDCTIVVLATMLAALIANLQSVRPARQSIASEMTTALAASNDRLHRRHQRDGGRLGLFDADDRIVFQ